MTIYERVTINQTVLLLCYVSMLKIPKHYKNYYKNVQIDLAGFEEKRNKQMFSWIHYSVEKLK